MLQPYTYLLVEFFTIIICFIASFDKRLLFNRQFLTFLKASSIAAIPFISWDIFFAWKGIWWFDYNYTIGVKIFYLPLEEWLFFFCIPFSCVFTYYILDKFYSWTWTKALNNFIVFFSLIVLIVVCFLFYEKVYTFVTSIATILVISYLYFIAKAQWIAQASVIFTILMLGFFPVNGVLTGTGLESPIVNYHPDHIIGIRMLTIPIEDAVYGYGQFLLVIYFFKFFQKRKANASKG